MLDLSGAWPLAALPLLALYAVCNRIWGGDPREVFGTPWSGRRLTIALLVLFGIPLGWLSAGLGGALVPILFGAWRSIVLAKDWATPDNPKEVALAFVRHLIPAGLVAGAIGIWTANGYVAPFEWTLVLFLAMHASLASALAVRFTHTEERLARMLQLGEISQSDCDLEIAEANGLTELLQGLSFAAAVFAWTLVR